LQDVQQLYLIIMNKILVFVIQLGMKMKYLLTKEIYCIIHGKDRKTKELLDSFLIMILITHMIQAINVDKHHILVIHSHH
jgi:hypothetical protein